MAMAMPTEKSAASGTTPPGVQLDLADASLPSVLACV